MSKTPGLDKQPENIGQREGMTRKEFIRILKGKLRTLVCDLENMESKDLIELDNVIEPWVLNAEN